MSDDLATTIGENAAGPRKAASDQTSVEQHSLPDQIAADKYLAAKRAAQTDGVGIRLFKLSPPGAA